MRRKTVLLSGFLFVLIVFGTTVFGPRAFAHNLIISETASSSYAGAISIGDPSVSRVS
ncbi:MAG: hypothetical protein IMZ69_04590 [Spirochaetes bacterium]|nr:hypothetical protein [Spirochaetota bacterium]